MSAQGRTIRGFTAWLRAQHYQVVEVGTRPQHVLDLDELARRYLGEPEPGRTPVRWDSEQADTESIRPRRQ